MPPYFPSKPRACARWLAALLALTALPHLLVGQITPWDGDLTALSLEDLGSVSMSAASKRTQRVFETPAAVSVITPEEMRRFGHASTAEALRMVPGAHVARNNTDRWSVGVRGFNGITSTKLLVLVDGRTVYSPFYAGVGWEQASLPLDDLARIEVVRGPGATLWGANAVNGIINLVARDARETQGGVMTVRDGSEDVLDAYVRQGFRLGEQSWWRVYARLQNESRSRAQTFGPAAEGIEKTRAGFRGDVLAGDALHFTVEGELLHSVSESEALNPSSSEPSMSLEHLNHAFLLGRLKWQDSVDRELTLQLYADVRDADASAVQRSLGTIAGGVAESGYSLDFDLTHRVRFNDRHDLVWGGGVRRVFMDVTLDESLVVQDTEVTQVLVNLFAQDEISLVPDKLRLTLGSKFEHHETVGWQMLPSVRLSYLASPTQTWWAAVSRAVRTPSHVERDSRLNVAMLPATETSPPVLVQYIGHPGFAEEKLVATELGWRWQASPQLMFESTAYYHSYSDLRDFEPVTSMQFNPPLVLQELVLRNRREADGYGFEASADWRITDRWHLAGTLAVARLRDSGTPSPVRLLQADLAQPRELWTLRSWWELPRNFEFSLAGYRVGAMREVQTPGYFRVDAQLSWRPRLDVEINLGVQNAFEDSHPEYISIMGGPQPEVRRNVFGRVKWSF